MIDDKGLKAELINYLNGSFTHKNLDEALVGFSEKLINSKPENIPYTFWQLLEHIRITQWDMVDFIHNPDYKEMEWPKDYWPSAEVKATKEMLDDSVRQIKRDLKTLEEIINNPSNNLMTPIPHGNGQTIFREVLQIIDHAAYHIGEFILMRRAMNNWNS